MEEGGDGGDVAGLRNAVDQQESGGAAAGTTTSRGRCHLPLIDQRELGAGAAAEKTLGGK